MADKTINVLLTRFPDNGSKVIEAITGFYYTHASIGLSEDMNTFYSFICKGFIVEKITRYLKPDRAPFPCQLYQIEVSDYVYASVKRILHIFTENKSTLHYTKLGLVLCLLHIPYKQKYHYFCSQFVADVLKYSQAVRLKKDSALYLPIDLHKLSEMKMVFEGNLQSMISHFGIQPCIA